MSDPAPTNGTAARLNAVDRRIDEIDIDVQRLFDAQSRSATELTANTTTLGNLREEQRELRRDVAALPGVVWKAVAAFGTIASVLLGVLSLVISQLPN